MITTLVNFVSAIYIVLALIMWYYNWRINKNVLFLSLFFIFFSLETTLYSIYVYGGSINYFTFLMISSPLFFLKAPMFYFFVRGINREQFYFKWIDLLHFIPFLINLSVNLPYLMTSLDIKIAISSSSLAHIESLSDFTVNSIYPSALNMIFRRIQLLAYIIACFFLIRRMKPMVLQYSGQLKYQYDYLVTRLKTLLFLILLIALIQVITNLFYFSDSSIGYIALMPTLLLTIALVAYLLIPLFVLFSPKMLYGMPHLETKHASAYRFENKLINDGKE